MPPPVFTPAGSRFGRLVTLASALRAGDEVSCRCDCGTVRSVCVHDLRTGNTQSCGCLWHEMRARQVGADGSTWKGDDASYGAFHLRIKRAKGTPSRCGRCGRSDDAVVYDWANLTGRYEDLGDYERMCRPCHRVFDADRRLVERRQEVARMTALGQSSRAIAAVLGVTHRTVLNDRRALERLK